MERRNQKGPLRRPGIAGALLVVALGTVGAAQDARAEVPCVWLRYNLPTAGSGGLSSCYRGPAPGTGQGSISPHHRQRVGSYYVEVRADLPVPD